MLHRHNSTLLTAAREESRDGTELRVIAAAREEFERYGIRRTTVEQVARRAGTSRVTVYRRFDGKAALVRAVVLDDIERFAAYVDSVWHSHDTVEDRLTETFTLALMAIRRNPLFNTLLRSEPEELLQQLTLDGEEIFQLSCAVLAARLQELIDDGELALVDVAAVSELVVRLGYSAILLPFRAFPGETEADIRRYVRSHVLPIVVGHPPTG
jgi:TetR/AcrR family transcriptional regulator, repressor for uid operon